MSSQTLPQVLKDVSIGTESPPRLSHAGPYQLCALLFCQSADGNNTDNYTPATQHVMWYGAVARWFGLVANSQSVAQKDGKLFRRHLRAVGGPQ